MDIDFLKENYLKMTDDELGLKLGISAEAIRRRRRKYGLIKPKTATRNSGKDEVVLYTERKEDTSNRAKLKKAYDKIVLLEEEKEELLKVKKTPQTFIFKKSKNAESEGVAVMIASDWHCEETVLPETVNGMNEYNLETAKTRAENFFINGVRLLKTHQRDTKIDSLILALLGDFITNSLREENLENNQLQPGDALWYAKSLLVAGIKYLLANTDVKIIIPCHTGNHGRLTERVHWSTESGNSLERYMYRDLAEYFENEPRIKFLIAEGLLSYVDVYDKTIRFTHGHTIKFGGGVGGITIPIKKAVSQWNKLKKADITVMGHFHQTFDGGDFMVNGSLIGWNAFGIAIKADYEPPQQTFFLIHNHAGGTKTGVCPIWLN